VVVWRIRRISIMNKNKSNDIQHLKHMLAEVLPYCIVECQDIKEWTLNNNKINFNFNWEKETSPVIFQKQILLEKCEKNYSVYMSGWFGGESLVKIDGKPFGEINVFHKEINLSSFADGKEHLIQVFTVPRGLFGTKEEAVFRYARLVKYDDELKKAVIYVNNMINISQESENDSLSLKIIEYTDDFLSSVYVPRDTDKYLLNILDNPSILSDVTNVWTHPEFTRPSHRDNSEVKTNFFGKFPEYKNALEKLKNLFPKTGKVYVMGHAHIDYAWLWPVDETKRKIERTFSNAIQLSAKYPEFIYSQSSAQMYKDIKELSPDVFEKIKKLVKEGKWEPAGGMWVESDCNVPSAESLIRQFYYGQTFFEKEFGKRANNCWLPDVFGFSWILPQILRQACIKYFATTKLFWNDTNDFPYDVCRWRGIDGSDVLYYSYKNMEDGYNGKISAKSIINTWNNFRQKGELSSILLSFGYGDGGGGPTEEMCENFHPLSQAAGIPQVEYSSASDFFDRLEKEVDYSKLPVWDSELYFELHRGTYTSQARTKRFHKLAENELRKAEILNTLFDCNNQNFLDSQWEVLLRNEFHDILPGSSIKEVYEDTETELSQVIQKSAELSEKIISEKASDKGLALFNPASTNNYMVFEHEKNMKVFFEGKELLKQKTFEGRYLYFIKEKISALDLVNLSAVHADEHSESIVFTDSRLMENEFIKATINDDGTVDIYHKKTGKTVSDHGMNRLMLYKNIPYYWENWDIDKNYYKSGVQLKAQSIETVEEGDIRKVIKVEYQIESSKIEQYYILYKTAQYIEVVSKVDWHMRRALLKAIFPTKVLNRYAKYDIDNGYIERPTHNNTVYEKAKFEVLGHRWVDISQEDFGVSVINDCKYGHYVKNSEIELSLIKSGIYPDFFADEGRHEFSYIIFPHESCSIKDVSLLAEQYNKRPEVFTGSVNCEYLKVKIDSEAFKIYSLRKTDEKNIYLRIAEVLGTSGKLTVTIDNTPIKAVYLTNILHDIEQKLEVKENTVSFNFDPFKIFTLMIETA
jgi:alpha-mannosidase